MIDTSEFPADYKPRIMAGMAKDYLGKQVLLLGKVKEVDTNGKNVKVTTCDGGVIMVMMKEPVSEPLKDFFVEFEGTVASRGGIKGDSYTLFSDKMTENFDINLYKEMVELCASEHVRNNFIITEVLDHHGCGVEGEIELINQQSENSGNVGDMMGERSFIDM